MRIAIGLLIMVFGLWLGITVAEHLWMGPATALIDAINAGRLDPVLVADSTFHLILALVAGYIVIAIFNGAGNTVMTEE